MDNNAVVSDREYWARITIDMLRNQVDDLEEYSTQNNDVYKDQIQLIRDVIATMEK